MQHQLPANVAHISVEGEQRDWANSVKQNANLFFDNFNLGGNLPNSGRMWWKKWIGHLVENVSRKPGPESPRLNKWGNSWKKLHIIHGIAVESSDLKKKSHLLFAQFGSFGNFRTSIVCGHCHWQLTASDPVVATNVQKQYQIGQKHQHGQVGTGQCWALAKQKPNGWSCFWWCAFMEKVETCQRLKVN